MTTTNMYVPPAYDSEDSCASRPSTAISDVKTLPGGVASGTPPDSPVSNDHAHRLKEQKVGCHEIWPGILF